MRKNKLPYLFLFLFLSVGSLFPQNQNYKINSIHFLPPQFYAGDTVELRVNFTFSGDKELALPPVMQEYSWLFIKKMELHEVRGAWELRAVFSSFQPGTRSFPPINLGGAVIEGIRIHTASLLAEQGDVVFVQAFNPVSLPGTGLLLGLGAAILLFGPLLLVIFGGRIVRALKERFQVKQRRRPYRRFLKRMAELDKRNGKIARDEFYTILAREFRNYLSLRLKRNFSPETTRDTKSIILKKYPEGSFSQPLFDLLESGDRFRFGNFKEAEGIEKELSVYRRSVEQLEETIKKSEQEYRSTRKKRRVAYVGS